MRKALGLLVLIATVATAAGPRKTPKPGYNMYSKEQDIQLGREAAKEVEQQLNVINDRELTDYINRIGKRLVTVGQLEEYPYFFKVVQEDSINAFALPGGPMYVHTGLIKAAENEAQIAGVLAHELSHVVLRHGTNQASKAQLFSIPAAIGGAIAGASVGGGMLGQLAQLGIGLGANSVLLKFSRGAESDADLLGMRTMAKAGYNPLEMARFFEKLESQSGNMNKLAVAFMASHPNPGDRVKAIEKETQYLPKAQYMAQEGNLQKMQGIIGGLPKLPPKKPVQQQQAGQGGPPQVEFSRNSKVYQGQGYTISYPDDWQTFPDKNGPGVTITGRNGVAQLQNGQAAVLYGVITGYQAAQNGQVDLRRDLDTLIKNVIQGNAGMQVSGQPQSIMIDGRNGAVVQLTSPSAAGGKEIDVLAAADVGSGLFYAVMVSPESEYQKMEPLFKEIVRTLRLQPKQ